MPDNAVFCSGCGTNQQGDITISQHKPIYEMKTITCYPTERAEQQTNEFYQDLGWEVLSMDRKQLNAGQTPNFFFDGSNVAYGGSTQHFTTQTHISIRRDKKMPNYDKIKELSDKAEYYRSEQKNPRPEYFGKESEIAKAKLAGCIWLIELFPVGLYFLIAGNRAEKKLKQDTIVYKQNIVKNYAIADEYRQQCKKLL